MKISWPTILPMVAAGLVVTAVYSFGETQDCTPGYCQTSQGENPDNDIWIDAWDNCLEAANDDQTDADNDGYGNRCDGDLNNNGVTNAQDYAIFRSRLGTANAIADLDSNGLVNSADYAIFRTLLGYEAGPSAPVFVTLEDDVYDTVVCTLANCEAGVFDPAENVATGHVAAGGHCYVLPESSVPTGIPGARWGAPSLEANGMTRCQVAP